MLAPETRSRPRRRPARLALFALLLLCALAAAGALVMALWNAVLVPALGAGPLNFWQALGLLLLCRLLFGRWGPPRRHGPPAALREHLGSLSPQQRERFRQHWQARCATRGQDTPGPDTDTKH